jgi:hypothetical protein
MALPSVVIRPRRYNVSTTEWIAHVAVLTKSYWTSIRDIKVKGGTAAQAASRAIREAKRQLRPGTRLHNVKVELVRVPAPVGSAARCEAVEKERTA